KFVSKTGLPISSRCFAYAWVSETESASTLGDSMKALVTGGAGLIGSHIVDLLLLKGYDVRILDNLEPCTHLGRKPEWVPKDVEFMQGDMRSTEDVERAVTGVDVIFHQAAYGGFAPELTKMTD